MVSCAMCHLYTISPDVYMHLPPHSETPLDTPSKPLQKPVEMLWRLCVLFSFVGIGEVVKVKLCFKLIMPGIGILGV